MNVPLRFDEVHRAPAKPGIYAWYHRLQLADADLKNLTQAVESAEDPAVEAKQFVERFIFGPLAEAPYNVKISGGLKPTYRGKVGHIPPGVSETLIQILTGSPEETQVLKGALLRAVPFFASPIYIGMAGKSLRNRLGQHRYLMDHYRDSSRDAPDGEDSDHSFAYEAVQLRHFLPSDLFVYTYPMDVTERVARAAEYILNRLNYPLCGRS